VSVVSQVYNEQRLLFGQLKEKRDKMASEFNTLQAAHDPLKRRLAEANKKSHGLSQEITRTVMSILFNMLPHILLSVFMSVHHIWPSGLLCCAPYGMECAAW